jgi:hypothetical protein
LESDLGIVEGGNVEIGEPVTPSTKLVEIGVEVDIRVKVVGIALEPWVPGRASAAVGTKRLLSESYWREPCIIGPLAGSLVPGLTEG